jgi:hypothetical protein
MKFCRDCKHFDSCDPVSVPSMGLSIGGWKTCYFTPGPQLCDPVSGREIGISGDPADRRKDATLCGLEARWFVQAKPTLKEKLFPNR